MSRRDVRAPVAPRADHLVGTRLIFRPPRLLTDLPPSPLSLPPLLLHSSPPAPSHFSWVYPSDCDGPSQHTEHIWSVEQQQQ